MSETIRLRGMCERAEAPEYRLGPDVVVPDQVKLTVEFSPTGPVGRAILTRDELGNIWADAEMPLDAPYAPGWSATFGEMIRKPGCDIRKTWPYFAIGIAHAVITKGTPDVVTAGEIREVALTRQNTDPDLPPWEVVTE
jgi:hypothetical protein